MRDIMEIACEARLLAENKNEFAEMFTSMFLDEICRMDAADTASLLQVNYDVIKSEYVATFRFPVCTEINIQKEFQEDVQSVDKIEVSQRAAECVALHIKSFYEQSADNRAAHTGEPCAKCKHWKVCNFDWRTNMKPFFDKTGIEPSLCRPRKR